MRSAAEGLEPAERDPVKLRKTALSLVAIILVGAIAITWAYVQYAAKTKEEFRPSFRGELKGHLKLQLADGEVTSTAKIEEDVWLLMQTTFEERDQHEEREKALASIPKEGVRQVVFYIDMDPNDEEDRAKMATLSAEEGIWKVAGKAEVISKYIRAVVKFGMPPYEKKGGEWIYDNSIAIVKRDRPEKGNTRLHLRGEIFDFDRALKQANEVGQPEIAEGYRNEWFGRTVRHLLGEGDPTKVVE